MEVKLKHRIVGILVLVALAIIIVPMFLTHSKTPQKFQTTWTGGQPEMPVPPDQSQKNLQLPPPVKTVDLQQTQTGTQVQTVASTQAAPALTSAPENAPSATSSAPAATSVPTSAQSAPGPAASPTPAAVTSPQASTATPEAATTGATASATDTTAQAAAGSSAVTDGTYDNRQTTANSPSESSTSSVQQTTPKAAPAIKPTSRLEHKPSPKKTVAAHHANSAASKKQSTTHTALAHSNTKRTKPHAKTAATRHVKTAAEQRHFAAQHAKLAAGTKAWIVQLGSFSEAKNVNNLMHKLRSKGFAVYAGKIKANGMTLIRVWVGPEVERSKAERIKERLQQEFNLKGIIVPYQV